MSLSAHRARQAPGWAPARRRERPVPAAARLGMMAARARRTSLDRLFWPGAALFLTLAIMGFSGGWTGGHVVLDGTGSTLWVRLLVHHWQTDGRFPYWVDDLWAGSPVPALVPIFPILFLVPVAMALGPEEAVKLGSLAAQLVGALGAVALARSLWGGRAAPVLAGLVFGLHPILVTHLGLWGAEPIGWVIAMMPWFAWSLRRALRGDGPRYLGLAALTGAFAVIQQAEHAYAVALLGGLYVVLAATRARARRSMATRPAGVLVRAVAVVVLTFAIAAHWLLPLLSLQHSFILVTEDNVRNFLVNGVSGEVGRNPGTFLNRSNGLLAQGPVGFPIQLAAVGSFYLGWVALTLTAVTIALVPRRDEEGYLTATLVAAAVGLLLSTGVVPLSRSTPALHGRGLPFAVGALLLGLACGAWVRRLGLGRARAVLACAAAGLFFAALPYVAPFMVLRKLVPLLSTIRFPRFYPLAILAVALGAAYPLARIERWASSRDRRLGPWLAASLAIAVAGLLMVDIRPYRSMYKLPQPADVKAGYPEAARWLAQRDGDFRIGTSSWGDAKGIEALMPSGRGLAVGWPNPIASKDVWRLTGAPWLGVSSADIILRGLGLAGGRYIVAEAPYGAPGATEARFADLAVNANPRYLPMVRAYSHAVVVKNGVVNPELAMALAFRGVGLVTGGPGAVEPVPASRRAVVGSDDPCRSPGVVAEDRWADGLAGDLSWACAVHRFLGLPQVVQPAAEGDQRVGAIFTAPSDGLSGVAVGFDRDARRAELALYEAGPDGRSRGREVARARTAAADVDGRWRFEFPAVEASAGRRYVFLLSCPACGRDEGPRMLSALTGEDKGDVVVDDRLQPGVAAIFQPVYPRLEAVPNPPADISYQRRGPGRWDVQVASDEPELVVVAQAWFPGWKATVDGRPVTVQEADGAFLGVAVGPGRHHLALRFPTPVAAWVGRGVTAGGLVAVLALLCWSRLVAWTRRHRSARPAAGGGPPASEGPDPAPASTGARRHRPANPAA